MKVKGGEKNPKPTNWHKDKDRLLSTQNIAQMILSSVIECSAAIYSKIGL
jgi:hypothetical protein